MMMMRCLRKIILVSNRRLCHASCVDQVLTVPHFVQLNILLDVLCKLYCVSCFSDTQQQDLLTEFEHFVIVWKRQSRGENASLFALVSSTISEQTVTTLGNVPAASDFHFHCYVLV